MSLRVKLTALQLATLRRVWPRLLSKVPPNCKQLANIVGQPWARLAWRFNQLAKKNVLRFWYCGPSRLWAPGPMSDHLQEEGLLP